jgi:hypothetical protein
VVTRRAPDAVNSSDPHLPRVAAPCIHKSMRWPDSDHCQNGRFFTPHAPSQPGFRAIFDWLTHREKTAWPKWISTRRGAPSPERLAAGELRATFVNHATVLLQIGELNVLTDPIWSEPVRCNSQVHAGIEHQGFALKTCRRSMSSC